MSFTVSKFGLTHRDGSKAYYAYLVMQEGGPALVIKRWGKRGAWGQVKVERYPHHEDARHAFNSIYGNKIDPKKGYRDDFNENMDLGSVEELQDELRDYIAKCPEVTKALKEFGEVAPADEPSPSSSSRKSAPSVKEQAQHQPAEWGSW